jgi:hypothetical protein
MSESLISQELIETIFVTLQEEDKNIKKIITGLFNFLRENNYSNNEIRIALQEFFSIRRDYIISEYNFNFNQVGFIVENLIANIPISMSNTSTNSNVSVSTNSNVSVSTNSNVSVSTDSNLNTVSDSNMIASSEVTTNSTTQTNSNDDELTDDEEIELRTRYIRSTFANRLQYPYINDPFLGLYTFSTNTGGNRFTSLFNQGSYYINSNGVQSSNSQQTSEIPQVSVQIPSNNNGQPLEYPATINLNYSSTSDLLNSLSNIFAAANSQYINVDDDEDEDEELEAIPSINNNAALNLFNMILNSPALTQLRAPHMEDVKNVINKEELNNLEIKDWSSLDKEKYKTCPICLDDYSEESKVRILKCEHGFHPDCVDNWLTKCNYKCPVCRDDSNKHHAEI